MADMPSDNVADRASSIVVKLLIVGAILLPLVLLAAFIIGVGADDY
jgi:hypothetical protein